MKVDGFINETHAADVAEVFGAELAERLADAEGTTFLALLFDLEEK